MSTLGSRPIAGRVRCSSSLRPLKESGPLLIFRDEAAPFLPPAVTLCSRWPSRTPTSSSLREWQPVTAFYSLLPVEFLRPASVAGRFARYAPQIVPPTEERLGDASLGSQVFA